MTFNDAKYVTDETGQRVAVLVGIDRYEELLGALEEMDSIRAYDAAKAERGESIPFENAVREIEGGRRRS